jgi:hypothetical protein
MSDVVKNNIVTQPSEHIDVDCDLPNIVFTDEYDVFFKSLRSFFLPKIHHKELYLEEDLPSIVEKRE